LPYVDVTYCKTFNKQTTNNWYYQNVSQIIQQKAYQLFTNSCRQPILSSSPSLPKATDVVSTSTTKKAAASIITSHLYPWGAQFESRPGYRPSSTATDWQLNCS
jgi:hypothetical protein